MLSTLRRAGEPFELSPGALVAETLVTSGTMTNRLDRLESRGHISRYRSRQDRRAVVVRLSSEGLRRVDGALEDLLASEAALLSPLSADERARLADLLKRLSKDAGQTMPDGPSPSH